MKVLWLVIPQIKTCNKWNILKLMMMMMILKMDVDDKINKAYIGNYVNEEKRCFKKILNKYKKIASNQLYSFYKF